MVKALSLMVFLLVFTSCSDLNIKNVKCERKTDCPTDAICTNNGYCELEANLKCELDKDCASGEFCNQEKLCEAFQSCVDNSRVCAENEKCNENTGQCISKCVTPCENDGICLSTGLCKCELGYIGDNCTECDLENGYLKDSVTQLCELKCTDGCADNELCNLNGVCESKCGGHEDCDEIHYCDYWGSSVCLETIVCSNSDDCDNTEYCYNNKCVPDYCKDYDNEDCGETENFICNESGRCQCKDGYSFQGDKCIKDVISCVEGKRTCSEDGRAIKTCQSDGRWIVNTENKDNCGAYNQVCLEVMGNVSCVCAEGYYELEDLSCIKKELCRTNNCSEHGECVYEPSTVFDECNCDEGYTGQNCLNCDANYIEDEANSTCVLCLEDSHCGSNGVCDINPDDSSLNTCVKCLDNSHCGSNGICNVSVDNSSLNVCTCKLNAHLSEETNKCVCDTGYTGANCDECDSGYTNSYVNHNECVKEVGFDECLDPVCLVDNQVCVQKIGTSIKFCQCKEGYVGSGCNYCDFGFYDDSNGGNLNCVKATCSSICGEGETCVDEGAGNFICVDDFTCNNITCGSAGECMLSRTGNSNEYLKPQCNCSSGFIEVDSGMEAPLCISMTNTVCNGINCGAGTCRPGAITGGTYEHYTCVCDEGKVRANSLDSSPCIEPCYDNSSCGIGRFCDTDNYRCVECLSDTNCDGDTYCNQDISRCVPNHCVNNTKDEDEVAKDCGGSCLIKCRVDQICNSNNDCKSNDCDSNICVYFSPE